jgi:hypothetical protein
MPPRSQVASLAPGRVLAEASGGTGNDASDALQGNILKGIGGERASAESIAAGKGLMLAPPRFFNLHDNGSLGGITEQLVYATFSGGGDELNTIWAGNLVDNGALRMSARGVITTIAVPGTLTIRAYFTDPANPTDTRLLGITPVVALLANLVTSPWEFDLFCTWTHDDNNEPDSVTMRAMGSFKIKNSLLDASPFNAFQLYEPGTPVDRNVDQQPDFSIEFSIAGNIFNVQTMTGEFV